MHSIKRKLKVAIIAIASLIAALVMFLIIVFLINKPENSLAKRIKDRDFKTIVIDELKYLPKEGVLNILIFGVDKDSTVEVVDGYRNSAVADFLAILSIDMNNESYSVTMINRDTITSVNILSISGESAGTADMQIGLSHTYRDGGSDSCNNVVKAVSELFWNIPIDGYIKLYLDSIPIMIDSFCGSQGLEITVPSAWKDLEEGETAYFSGTEVQEFVRARQGVDDGTNLSRMKRQQAFIQAFLNKTKTISETFSFTSFLKNTKECYYSNLNSQDMLDIYNFAKDYEFNSFYNYTGVQEVRTVIYYYPNQESIKSIVKEVFVDERRD